MLKLVVERAGFKELWESSLLLSVVPEGAVLGATATLVPTTKGCGVTTEGLRPI